MDVDCCEVSEDRSEAGTEMEADAGSVEEASERKDGRIGSNNAATVYSVP